MKPLSLVLICCSLIATITPLHATNLLAEINACRLQEGASILPEDAVLSRTATLYSRRLTRQGQLSHKDSSGKRALQRYRDQGGTCAEVAEILGAGASFSGVMRAWLASPAHRNVLLGATWTDCGAGSYQKGENTVYVVLFIRKKIRELTLYIGEGSWQIRGCLTEPSCGPVLLRTLYREYEPEAWDQQSGIFQFTLPDPGIPLSLRLGYRNNAGTFILCDVLYPDFSLTTAEK